MNKFEKYQNLLRIRKRLKNLLWCGSSAYRYSTYEYSLCLLTKKHYSCYFPAEYSCFIRQYYLIYPGFNLHDDPKTSRNYWWPLNDKGFERRLQFVELMIQYYNPRNKRSVLEIINQNSQKSKKWDGTIVKDAAQQ